MPEPEPAADIDLIVAAAEAAGPIALSYFRKNPAAWDKADASPVTEADLAVNTALQARLMAARPDYGWLSEESEDDGGRLTAARSFIVDPIDGTRAFISGSSAWAHAIAVVEDGQVTAATVHMPQQGKTYSARRGGGATLNGSPISCGTRSALQGAQVLTSKSVLKPENWSPPLPEMTQHVRPSLAYRICLVAEGRFDACLTLRDAWEWDTAAASLIAAEAGAQITDAAGGQIRFNAPVPRHAGLIATNPDLHRAFLARRPSRPAA